MTTAAPELSQASPALLTLEGEVVRVVFENADTGFRVLKVQVDGGKPSDQAEAWVGSFPGAAQGMRVRATGLRENDGRRGPQFKVTTLEPLVPTSLDGVTAYLGSGLIHGIGPDLARKIVAMFGEKTIAVLDTDPAALKRVKGIGDKKLASISAAWVEQRVIAEVMSFLAQHGASPGLATKILAEYGQDKAMQVVRESPYKLAVDIDGVGFKTADRIALASGLPADSAERAQAAVLHALNEQFTLKGHVYAEARPLVDGTAEMLERDPAAVAEAVVSLARARRVVVERVPLGPEGELGDIVYPAHLHRAEVRLAGELRRLLHADPPAPVKGAPPLAEAAPQAIATFEARAKVTLAPAQRDAVMLLGSSKVVVITGGPGTGKSTLLRAALATLEAAGLDVLLGAPTGRAAKRMEETSGHEATTIHRLLEYDAPSRTYLRNAMCQLDCGVVIIDEASMLDLPLADVLLQAIPDHARLVLVGDIDQLPSVGPGAVLRDVIGSGVVPVVRLEQVFRQAAGSLISLNAQRINRGEDPESAEGADGEFYVLTRKTPPGASRPDPSTMATWAADTIVEMVTRRIPARFGWDPMRDVQVLTPMHKGDTGTIVMNDRLQAALNPAAADKAELRRGGWVLRVGDKVMQVKNDRERDISNGDSGYVTEIDTDEKRVTVDFDGRVVTCEGAKQLDQLKLAYACTIHKSQGSEYPCVVIPFLTAHYMMLTRNILYTGATRSKRLCVLVTDPRALKLALAEARREERATMLAQRLRGDVSAEALQ